ncbi:AAA family ATPase [Chromobacterium haemolyticum]|uniref:AAA family ATPase n=1 Tax=Chromobacterium haemolyticum TaxID=394935 RepID=UPI0009D98430|nr:AAA family ATPase [Chromobacterium haemolyticum]OQS32112.1 hypothetical protein B0T39_23055 [Chromobacterium haemolyticum]
MKISSVTIKNFQGLRHAALNLSTRIALIAGDNGAGKSSMCEAIAMALSGHASRVSKKKDFAQLLREGQKSGEIHVEFSDGRAAALKLPSGKVIFSGGAAPDDIDSMRAALPYVLNPAAFAMATADERRAALFELTGCSIDEERVAQLLDERGADSRYIEAILPLIGAGFPAAEADALRRATEARGAWKAIAGENYGDKKSEDWKAEADGPVDESLLLQSEQELDAIEIELGNVQLKLGEVQGRRQALQLAADQVTGLEERAGRLERLQSSLARDEAERDDWAARVALLQASQLSQAALPCPCCGVMLVNFDGVLAEATPLARGTEDDLAGLPQALESLALMQRTTENTRRAIEDAKTAAAQLESLQAISAEPTDDVELRAQEELANSLRAKRQSLTLQLEALRKQQRAAAEAESKTNAAAQHHEDVQAWSQIAKAMAPDGIPAEILADALQPVNDHLFQLSQMACWPRVQIGHSMEITSDGRAYGLLSESEQWRADCVIALSLAILSGLRLVLLDRFDVLSLAGRDQLLDMLEGLDELIDTALVFGTLKAAPPSDEIVQAIWLQNGEVMPNRTDRKAA